MEMHLLLLLVIVAMASSYPHFIEDGNGNELELVQLVPLSRVPRSTQQHRYNKKNNYYYNKRRPLGYEEQQMINPEKPQFIEISEEPLVASGSRKEPLITAETGHSQPYDYVDYGAYTGGYGAFGWYSDHPVQTGY